MAIILIGMLDEREPALRMAKREIAKRGHETVLIDISIGNGAIVPDLQPEVDNHRIAGYGKTTMDEIRQLLAVDRERVTAMMAEGLSVELTALHDAGCVDGVMAVVGMTGAMICLPALKKLSYGTPKLLISTVAAMPTYARQLAEYFGFRDITVMNSVVDTVGLNSMVKRVLINGAGAICGMAETKRDDFSEKPAIAITEFGFCDTAAQLIRDRLEPDFDMVSFHAAGVGEQAALDYVGHGRFEAFIDLVPAGFSEYLLGGNRSVGPHRFDVGLNLGKPYILAPCGFDMIGCGPIERRNQKDPLWVTRGLADRQLIIQDALRVQARTTPEEMQLIARQTADRLNQSSMPHLIKFIIPTRGFSSLSVQGAGLHRPEADSAFIQTLKQSLNKCIELLEVDADINAPPFAATVARVLQKMLNSQRD